ncbi:MAG TPA: hypothetical protein VGX21_18195 [Methylomirabilota bacterium]|nr:hypothetical protein [Methylomirabilota bacterium]
MLARALCLTAVWLSPAALLGLAPLLLADGTRGLGPPLALGGGAVLAAVLLAGPWARVPTDRGTLVDLGRRRWPSAALQPLAVATAGSAFLFVWAQLAALGELGRALGWPRPLPIGVAVIALALAAWRREAGAPAAAFGAALALMGLVVPLIAVLAATDPVWPRVWAEVASRPDLVFAADGPWVRDGHPVHGVGRELMLPVTEEQRVVLLGRGPVRVEAWEGGTSRQHIAAPVDLTLRPGDRLVVPDGFPVRFEAGRRIPGAPPSGIAWADLPERPYDQGRLVGLGVALAFGALGLAPGHALLPAGRAGDRAAVLAAALAIVGLAASLLWSLYAAWLVPEVYLGGVAGSEVYELPGAVAALGSVGPALRDLALLGLAAGGFTGALAALAGAARAAWPEHHGAALVLAFVVPAAVLAAAAPVGAWPVLIAAFGLAASAAAPAAVLAGWRERLSPRGVAMGASVGLVVFVGLTVGHLWQLAGLGGAAPESWVGFLAAWPSLTAMPLNALVAWTLSPGPRPSPRAPLSPGFADLQG